MADQELADPLADLKAEIAAEETKEAVERQEVAQPEPEVEDEKEPDAESEEDKDKPKAEIKPKEAKPRKDWQRARIDELTAKGAEKDDRIQALTRELESLKVTPPKAEPDETDEDAKPLTKAEVERIRQDAIEQARREIKAETDAAEFNRRADAIYDDGAKVYGQEEWDDALSNFRALGGLTPTLVEIAGDTDNPAKVLFLLGSDPENAARVMKLPPHKAAIEMARLANSRAPAGKGPVSKAPPPPRTVDGAARTADGFNDNMSDDQFDKEFGKVLEKLASRQ